jgi:tripartite-type tricarboxylate transporter receptor subunit TctC
VLPRGSINYIKGGYVMNKTMCRKAFPVIIVLAVMLLTVMSALFGGSWAAEEKYPSRYVELWYPYPPGGAVDQQNRILAGALQKYLGGTVVSVSKAGGGGVICVNALANSAPDGYTIAQASFGSIVEAVLRSKGKLTIDDIRIIAQWNVFGNSLAVPVDSQFKTFSELLDYAKKNPGLRFGNPGVGATPTIRMENLNLAANLKMIGVPFKGDTEVVGALLGKHVPVGVLSTFSAKTQADGGKLRILFSFDPTSLYGLDPKIPTLANTFDKSIVENDLETVGFVFVPKKTPEKVVKQIEEALQKACKDPEVIKGVGKVGAVPAFIEGKAATNKLKRIMVRVMLIHTQGPASAPKK